MATMSLFNPKPHTIDLVAGASGIVETQLQLEKLPNQNHQRATLAKGRLFVDLLYEQLLLSKKIAGQLPY